MAAVGLWVASGRISSAQQITDAMVRLPANDRGGSSRGRPASERAGLRGTVGSPGLLPRLLRAGFPQTVASGQCERGLWRGPGLCGSGLIWGSKSLPRVPVLAALPHFLSEGTEPTSWI